MDVTTVATVSEDSGTFIHFKDVTGEMLYDIEGEGDAQKKSPVGAVVAGTYSDRYRKALRKVKAQNVQLVRDGEKFDEDTLDARDFALQAACIVEWTFTANGQPYKITADNWQALVAKQPQWQDQVEMAMHNHARFLAKKSAA